MENKKSIFFGYAFTKEGLLPEEEYLAVSTRKRNLVIGIPKESSEIDSVVLLTPESVELLVNNGNEVVIESGAGLGANYKDSDYSERGGFIVDNKDLVLKSDIILKAAPLTLDEADMLKGNQLIVSSLHINKYTKEFIRKLMHKKVTAIAYENIKDENGSFPIERTLNAISGKTAILVAAELLSKSVQGKGVMLGGIAGVSPAEVVILGAGTAAEYAARAAIGLGATVKIFDDSVYNLQTLQDKLGHNIFTSIYHPKVLRKALRSAEVVIGAISTKNNYPKVIVTEEMVKEMKEDSVIIDLSIGQGGCFETSECRTLKSPVYKKHGVIHYAVPNMPSRVSRTSSIAMSNVFTPLFMQMSHLGGFKQHILEDMGLRNGVYLYNGILTNPYIGKIYDIPSQDIDLLLAAFNK